MVQQVYKTRKAVPLTNFCLTPNLILNEGGKLAEKNVSLYLPFSPPASH